MKYDTIGDILNLSERSDGDIVVCGRVKTIRDFGHLKFIKLQDQTGEIQVVLERNDKIKRGDHIQVWGKSIMSDGRYELRATDIMQLGAQNSRGVMANYFQENRLKALFIRSKAIEAIHKFFLENEFMHVHSPSIVSDWVNGQTGAFQVDFYGEPCNLTISNMMYHEIMMINGFSRIYEIAKIFRQEHPSSIHRLAEFTIIDVGLAYQNSEYMMGIIESMICEIYKELSEFEIPGFSSNLKFERISFDELVKRAGCPVFSGSQFPKTVRRYLNENYESFVWVVGFPERKRPFFVRSENGVCFDYQLWYRGTIYLAAGGERETSLERIQEKICAEGKSVLRYEEILRFFETSVPPMCGIGMGIERFLASVIPNTQVADYIAFPRYQKHFSP